MRVALALFGLLGFSPQLGATDQPDCPITPINQEFEWTRQLQGIEQPFSWKVQRDIEFEDLDDGTNHAATEKLTLILPEFRWRFQRYMGSAKVESCETRFYVQAKTPTATADALTMPLVIRFQEARCGAVDQECVESANLIGECRRRERQLVSENIAELDVTYQFGYEPRELRMQVFADSETVYGTLDSQQALALFGQVVDAGADALALISDTLGQVSLARLIPVLQPQQVEGGFTTNTGSRFELTATYRLNAGGLCGVRKNIEEFGARYLPAS